MRKKKTKNYFINGNCQTYPMDCSRYHFDFTVKYIGISDSLENFNRLTYFSAQKRYVARSLNTYTISDSALLSCDPVPNGSGALLQFYKYFMDLPANAPIKD